MKWLKYGTGKILYSMQLFLHHILFVEILIGWIKVLLYSVCLNYVNSVCHKRNCNQIVKVEKMVVLVKTFDHCRQKFLSCKIKKQIWNWNLDWNLIMALLIMATCLVLSEKLYTILRYKEPRRQEITNFLSKCSK